MRSLDSVRLPRARLAPVLAEIPFFARVQAMAPKQAQLLLEHARLLELRPGEVVIRRGEFDSWFFFVLKGHLRVGREEDGSGTLALLAPGEVFGALAVIRDSERSATIAAGLEGPAILLGIDAAPFGDLEELEPVSLGTKQIFLETVNQALRARLEAYRHHFPGHVLVKRLLPDASELSPDLDSLRALAEEADHLGELLVSWNESLSEDEHARFAATTEARPDRVGSWEDLVGAG